MTLGYLPNDVEEQKVGALYRRRDQESDPWNKLQMKKNREWLKKHIRIHIIMCFLEHKICQTYRTHTKNLITISQAVSES